ncbi:MAG: hypothetical protein ACRDNY_12815 [Gaiellaceae bacterium]
MIRSLVLAALALAALSVAPLAQAHQGGKAEPRIAAALSADPGTVRLLDVRLTDLDSGKLVRGATVVATAEMNEPHLMRLAPWPLSETAPGLYRARVRFAMPARWTVSIAVSGERVVAARSSLQATVDGGGVGASPVEPGTPDLQPLPTRLEDELSDRDYVSMAILWVHGLAALGWIVGVLVMLVALGTDPGVLADGVRGKVRDAYGEWGAWLHWSLVPWIVLTGIYNMLVVTPFPLAWRPSDVRQLTDVPYGALYEAILIVKLGLFAALLVTGTQLLLRTVRAPVSAPAGNPHPPGFARTLARALGAPGFVYLATVPLILAAAMALRYIHILSHVADVLQRG